VNAEDGTPVIPTADLKLNPLQIEAADIVGGVLDGKFRLVGVSTEDHAQIGIIPADLSTKQGRTFRVTAEGMVVPTLDGEDVGNPMPALLFGVLAMSYPQFASSPEDQNLVFLDTAKMVVALQMSGQIPIDFAIMTIRSGARKEGLL
jgi:hypothetical protein